MLISLIILATFVISAAANWLSNAAAPLRSDNSPVTPRDPSTFALALIAVGTIAIYWIATRRPPRASQPRPRRFSDQPTRPRSNDAAGEPARDAA